MLFCICFFSSKCLNSQEKERTPNVIIILADDMGYGDLGCNGNTIIKTSNIDRLAYEVLRITDFYSSGSWCVPSRKGLLTGVHPYRKGMETITARTTMAEMLKEKGYHATIFGKWHLGMKDGLHLLDNVFDYFYGTEANSDIPAPKVKKQIYEVFKTATDEDWPVPLYRNQERIEFPAKQSLFTKRYTEESIRFIKENKDTPFFLYLAHNMPHVPLFAFENFRRKSEGGIYGNVIEELDWSVGEIIKTLKKEGIIENTLVIFTSDNGPWTCFKEFGGTAKPLRGEKGTGWEGGSGVPAIFYWPGLIEPDISAQFMVNIDIFATIATITDSDLPNGDTIDSKDMTRVLLNREKSPRDNYLFFSSSRWKTPFSYRSENYKIHLQSNDMSRNLYTNEGVEVKHYDPLIL